MSTVKTIGRAFLFVAVLIMLAGVCGVYGGTRGNLPGSAVDTPLDHAMERLFIATAVLGLLLTIGVYLWEERRR
jgi:Na+/H+-translocating membrane pyrophosphatase